MAMDMKKQKEKQSSNRCSLEGKSPFMQFSARKEIFVKNALNGLRSIAKSI